MRQPVQNRGKETRDKILKAGMKLFSEKGYYATNSKEIARESGLAIGSFYSYFKDKKILFKELLKKYKEIIISKNNKNLYLKKDVSMDKTIFVRNMIKSLLNLSDEIHPLFHREVLVMRFQDEEINDLYNEYRGQSIRSIHKFIENSKTLIPSSSIPAASEILYNANEFLIISIHSFPSINPIDDLVEQQVKMILRYLWGK